MAVSHKTAAGYGGGCFLLPAGGASRLPGLVSARRRLLISPHKTRFFSMVSIMVTSPHSHGI